MEYELRFLYNGYGRAYPQAFEFLNAALAVLSEIKTMDLHEAMVACIRENEYATPPSFGKILQIWRKSGSSSVDWHGKRIKDMMRRRLENETGFTPEQIQDARNILNGNITDLSPQL